MTENTENEPRRDEDVDDVTFRPDAVSVEPVADEVDEDTQPDEVPDEDDDDEDDDDEDDDDEGDTPRRRH